MRVVTVQHYGSEKTYTFLCNYDVKPGDILLADANGLYQQVRALTSDYEVLDQDIGSMFKYRPHKKIVGKTMNTCYCNGTKAQEIPVPSMELKPVTYFASRRWVSAEEYTPEDGKMVLARTDNEDLYLVMWSKSLNDWIDAYAGRKLPRHVTEWLNIDIENRGKLTEATLDGKETE